MAPGAYDEGMCGRFAMNQDADDIIAAYVAAGGSPQDAKTAWMTDFEQRLRPSYNISPTDEVALVRERVDTDSNEVSRQVSIGVWDLRPHWRTKLGKPMINARLESVGEKPLWRRAFERRRVLVPMNGYFEWTGSKGDRTPSFIHSDQTPLLSAAGIGEVRNIGAEDDPQWEVSCAIITRKAHDASGVVHDRMPCLLGEEHWSTWLDPTPLDAGDSGSMLDLLRDASEELMPTIVAHRVDPQVNHAGAGADDPATVRPVE